MEFVDFILCPIPIYPLVGTSGFFLLLPTTPSLWEEWNFISLIPTNKILQYKLKFR